MEKTWEERAKDLAIKISSYGINIGLDMLVSHAQLKGLSTINADREYWQNKIEESKKYIWEQINELIANEKGEK